MNDSLNRIIENILILITFSFFFFFKSVLHFCIVQLTFVLLLYYSRIIYVGRVHSHSISDHEYIHLKYLILYQIEFRTSIIMYAFGYKNINTNVLGQYNYWF